MLALRLDQAGAVVSGPRQLPQTDSINNARRVLDLLPEKVAILGALEQDAVDLSRLRSSGRRVVYVC